MRMQLRSVLPACLFASLLTAAPAFAQNWSFDARNVALGGIGSTSNVAFDMIDEQRPYRAIVVPLGLLFQVLPNLPSLNPSKDEFDIVRTIEYAASPLHFIVGRDNTTTASVFVTDLRNGELNRDLNTYRGFSPQTDVSAEGLASPNWGHTFKVKEGNNGAFHGVYAGGGIYFSMNAAATIDPALAELFASPVPVFAPNTSFFMSNDTESQFGMAITGGYRARFALGGGGSGRFNADLEGLYVGVNFHYLHGFDYEHIQPQARLDTNAQGLLTVNASQGLPVTIDRTHSTSGNGFATDIGVSAVVGRWQVGLGVNGIGNHIVWSGAEQTRYALDSLFSGGEFVDLPTVPVDDVRVELPVDTRANAAYSSERWTAVTEFGNGYNGTSFRGAFEQRFGRTQLRGGARYVNDRWEPTGGAGYNVTDRFGIDVGLFGTSANLERHRRLAIAVSMRFMSKNL